MKRQARTGQIAAAMALLVGLPGSALAVPFADGDQLTFSWFSQFVSAEADVEYTATGPADFGDSTPIDLLEDGSGTRENIDVEWKGSGSQDGFVVELEVPEQALVQSPNGGDVLPSSLSLNFGDIGTDDGSKYEVSNVTLTLNGNSLWTSIAPFGQPVTLGFDLGVTMAEFDTPLALNMLSTMDMEQMTLGFSVKPIGQGGTASEPGILAMLGAGLAGMGLFLRRRRR